MTLTEFLLARIAEDEAVGADPYVMPQHHPDRWAAECEAKRQIVASVDYHREYSGDVTPASDDLAKTTLRALALPYADHPAYREEWRP